MNNLWLRDEFLAMNLSKPTDVNYIVQKSRISRHMINLFLDWFLFMKIKTTREIYTVFLFEQRHAHERTSYLQVLCSEPSLSSTVLFFKINFTRFFMKLSIF